MNNNLLYSNIDILLKKLILIDKTGDFNMKNSIKLMRLILSGLLITSVNAGQKETPENLVVNRLIKIGVIINDIKNMKVGTYVYEGKYQIEKNISSKLVDLAGYLNDIFNRPLYPFDKNTTEQIIKRLNQSPKNLIFKNFVIFLTSNQESVFNIEGIGFIPVNIRGTLRSAAGFKTKQEFVNFVANIIKKLGDEPAASEFIKLNK